MPKPGLGQRCSLQALKGKARIKDTHAGDFSEGQKSNNKYRAQKGF